MKRKIIKIDRDKCDGCGLCVRACHEGALELAAGKARLITDVYCDGLGDCLPECPQGAIVLEEREAEAFDEEAVKKKIAERNLMTLTGKSACGCTGDRAEMTERTESQLRQWPCQIKLVPVQAPYFENAHLLIAADCTAYAYANIHQDYMQDRVTLIGCPKLDDVDYGEKLTQVLIQNELKSVTVLRMEVPCCGGIAQAVKTALQNSGKTIPGRIITVKRDGGILEND